MTTPAHKTGHTTMVFPPVDMLPIGQLSAGGKLLLCTYQNPTNSLPTPTMVGVGRPFFKLKSDDLTFIRKVCLESYTHVHPLLAEHKTDTYQDK